MAALLGVYFPTSFNGQVSTALGLGSSLGVILLFLISIDLNRWQLNRIRYLLILVSIIILSTAISPFPYVAWGGLVPYILASIVLLTDFKWIHRIKYSRFDQFLVYTISSFNLFILIIGLGVIINNQPSIEFLQDYYQSIGEELFEQMVIWYSKPVTVFGSHSTAAFAYFSLFAINLKLALTINLNKILRIFFLLSSIGFLILNYSLLSNTSTLTVFLMAVLIMVQINRIIPPGARVIFNTLLFIVALIIIYDLNIVQLLIGDSVDNGILARYTPGGRLQETYNYLIDNYFAPIGISYDPKISLGDNFIAEYIIKISAVGYLIILYLLWTWLRRHLNHYTTIIFFGFFILSDLAYPLLVYDRFAKVLPFFVLLWSRSESKYFMKKLEKNIFICKQSLIVKS